MGQRSILVVEDEPLIAMMLEDFLESLGHSVTATCESVSDAMAEADKGGFDLAFQIHVQDGEIEPALVRFGHSVRYGFARRRNRVAE